MLFVRVTTTKDDRKESSTSFSSSAVAKRVICHGPPSEYQVMFETREKHHQKHEMLKRFTGRREKLEDDSIRQRQPTATNPETDAEVR